MLLLQKSEIKVVGPGYSLDPVKREHCSAMNARSDPPAFRAARVPRFLRALVLVLAAFLTLPAQAACSSWLSPQKVWLNEYFFGSGSNAPPNFLELYSTSNTYSTQWHGSYVEVYSAANTKTTYTFTNATATACTISNKTWVTYNVLGGLRQQNALVILRDPGGNAIDAFVFDNSTPPAPWTSASNNWAPSQTTGCSALDAALTTQAGLSGTTPKQANMLVLGNYGNKDMARTPDGGPIWDLTSNTGAGTTYTQCTGNNANFQKTVDNSTPTPGSTVTFTLSMANTGGSALSGIVVDDYLPDYPVTGAPTYVSAIPVNALDGVSTSTYATTDPNTNTPGNATKITWSPTSIAASTTAILHIKMQVPATATTGNIYNNTAQTTAGLDPSQTDFANITIGSPNVGSFVIVVSPATASTCTPATSGPKVTVTAMTEPNGAGSVNTGYAGTAYLSASTANPKWYNSAGTLITVSPAPAGSFVNGVAIFYLTDAAAETITVSALDVTTYDPNVMQGASGNIMFTSGSSGIVLIDGEPLSPGSAWSVANPAYGAVAGRPHKVRATLTSCGVTDTSRTGSYSGTIMYIGGLNHPAGASAPTVATNASCANPIGPLSTGTGMAITLAFTSGVADFYLCTSDVGQYALSLSLNLTSPTASVNGNSGNFTARPFVVTASGFPASPPLAGGSFTGTFTAWPWLSSADTDSNGIPDILATPATIAAALGSTHTPRFSGTTNAAGVVNLSPVMIAPAICPASPCACTLSPTTLTLTSGTATSNSLNYTEAGSIKIGGGNAATAYAATNYLGAAGLNVPILSDTIRLIPAYFDTATTDTCSPSFAYSAQPFTVSVTARNTAGSKTCNYDGAAGTAKAVTLTDGNALTVGSLSNTSVPYTSFSTGVASSVRTPTYSFTVPPTGPSIILLRATESSGGDGVSSSVSTATYPLHVEGSLEIRSGRIKLSNFFGSEKRDLQIPVQVQYWSGQSWVLSGDDACTGTVLTAAGGKDAVALSGYVAPLSSTNLGSSHVSGFMADGGGKWKLTLAMPSPVATGSVDVAINLGSGTADLSCLSSHPATTGLNLPWLRSRNGSCAITYDRDPSARATFGIYAPETKKTVHVRELY